MYQEEAEQGLLASSGLFRIARMIVTKIQGESRVAPNGGGLAIPQCEAEFAIYHDRKPRAFSHFDHHYDLDLALDPEYRSRPSQGPAHGCGVERSERGSRLERDRILVVIQPSQRDLTRNDILNYNDFARYPNYRPSYLSGAVEDICRRNDLECINLFPIFQKNDPASLFFKRDDH